MRRWLSESNRETDFIHFEYYFGLLDYHFQQITDSLRTDGLQNRTEKTISPASNAIFDILDFRFQQLIDGLRTDGTQNRTKKPISSPLNIIFDIPGRVGW